MMGENILSEAQPSTINLGGKEYKLSSLNLNVMCAIEDEFDCNFSEFGNVLAKSKQVTALRKLIFILLKDNYPELTPADVGKLITLDNIGQLDEAIGNALFSDKYAELKAKMPKPKAITRNST